MTAATRATKAAALSKAPTRRRAGGSEADSAYTRVAAVVAEAAVDSNEEIEEGDRVDTRKTTRSMQIETGDMTPMISTPSESNTLCSIAGGRREAARGRDPAICRRTERR